MPLINFKKDGLERIRFSGGRSVGTGTETETEIGSPHLRTQEKFL